MKHLLPRIYLSQSSKGIPNEFLTRKYTQMFKLID